MTVSSPAVGLVARCGMFHSSVCSGAPFRVLRAGSLVCMPVGRFLCLPAIVQAWTLAEIDCALMEVRAQHYKTVGGHIKPGFCRMLLLAQLTARSQAERADDTLRAPCLRSGKEDKRKHAISSIFS